jgi:hypothetical protein
MSYFSTAGLPDTRPLFDVPALMVVGLVLLVVMSLATYEAKRSSERLRRRPKR